MMVRSWSKREMSERSRVVGKVTKYYRSISWRVRSISVDQLEMLDMDNLEFAKLFVKDLAIAISKTSSMRRSALQKGVTFSSPVTQTATPRNKSATTT